MGHSIGHIQNTSMNATVEERDHGTGDKGQGLRSDAWETKWLKKNLKI